MNQLDDIDIPQVTHIGWASKTIYKEDIKLIRTRPSPGTHHNVTTTILEAHGEYYYADHGPDVKIDQIINYLSRYYQHIEPKPHLAFPAHTYRPRALAAWVSRKCRTY